MSGNDSGNAQQPPPQVSPDGRFWWNGSEWVPFDGRPTGDSATPRDSSGEVAKGLGQFVVGLLIIPAAFVLLIVVATAVSMGSIQSAIVPLLIAGGLVYWYRKRLR